MISDSTTAVGALASGLLTVTLFLYILLVQWIKGVEPNVRVIVASRIGLTLSLVQGMARTRHSLVRNSRQLSARLGRGAGDCYRFFRVDPDRVNRRRPPSSCVDAWAMVEFGIFTGNHRW